MKMNNMAYGMIVTGIFIFSLFAIISFIPRSSPTSFIFPFHVDGGTLLKSDPELLTATIWGQGQTITLIQMLNKPSKLFNITLLNFRTKNLVVSGLLFEESYNILSETSCSLKLMSTTSNHSIVISAIDSNEGSIKFLTIGDTQGFTQLFTDMLKHPLISESDFVLHVGDISPTGSRSTLEVFSNLSKKSSIPVYSTPGNHDIKESNNTDNYEQYFGKAEYFFNYSNVLFISLNSSSGIFSESSIVFLTQILNNFPTSPKILFTHMPLFDPRFGENHSLLDETQANEIISKISGKNVKAIISGHIHLFNHTIINGTHFITSGGGGARLYADPDEGGYHHFTEITFDLLTNNLSVDPVHLNKQTTPTDISIRKDTFYQNITLFDLQSEFPIIQRFSSFQNQYDNWRDYGYYEGVKVSSLLHLVGGLDTNEILQIESWDGLTANYSHSVIYPNSSWLEIQGEMILAFSYNNTVVPEYTDGYRIVFTPSDSGYSNEDCQNTSPIGEGWHIWPSAGYRWLKYIKSLTIIDMVNFE